MLTALTVSDLGGQELILETAGTTSNFTSTGGMVMSATLTLVLPSDYDSTNSSHPVTFELGGPFVTAASTKVVFKTPGGDIIEYGTDASYVISTVMRTEYLRLAGFVRWELANGAVTLGASSVVAGNITTEAGVMTLGAGAVVTGAMMNTLGAVALGANAKSGPITAGSGAVLLGANVKTGDITATAGAITLGAGTVTGDLDSPGAAITFGAGATADGNVKSGFAITFGAGAFANGLVKAGAAITFGAGSGSCGYCSAAATTLGAGYNIGPALPTPVDCTGVSSGCVTEFPSGTCGATACTYPAA
jgi:hypothetical protein